MDLASRVDLSAAFTTISDGLGTGDCAGSGTAAAAIAGGTNHGVAKGVTLHPVRVAGCSGSAAAADSFTVTLTVTDDAGQTAGAGRVVSLVPTP